MQATSVATGLASRASRSRLIAHVVAGLGSWAIFLVLAIWQFGSFAPRGYGADLAALATAGGGFFVIGIAWVRWNQSIYRRRHRRTSPLVRVVDFERDTLGRQIAAAPGVREAAGQIVVSIDGETGRKCYRTGRAQSVPPPLPVRANRAA